MFDAMEGELNHDADRSAAQSTGSPHTRLVSPDESGAPAVEYSLPTVIRREEAAQYRELFAQELQPLGVIEVAIVNDLARHAAGMERWADAAEAVQRQGARCLPQFSSALDESTLADAVLAGAMSTDAADRCERQTLGHSRAFYRALQKLDEIQARRRKRESPAGIGPPPGFVDERACEEYLVERFRRGENVCYRCGATAGCYLTARRSWECGRCHFQMGLRAGTVMARSPIPLHVWFEAIRWLLWTPTLSTVELTAKTGIRRPTTVRAVARRIRRAMGSEDASTQLAGLDRYFSRDGRTT